MIEPVKYLQGDSRWGNNNYSAPGESKTISSSGCGVTAAAMIIQTLRPDLRVTPADTAKWSMKHGYKYLNQGTAYTYFTPQFKEYGISCKLLNSTDARSLRDEPKKKLFSKVKESLKTDGSFIIACMGPGNWTTTGHYIVAYKMDDTYTYIHDPASTSMHREKGVNSIFLSQAKYFWRVSWGTKTKVIQKGKLYEKPDVVSRKKDVLFASYVIWHAKDCKNGWSIICTEDNVGYCKNTVLHPVGKSKYPKTTILKDCFMKKKNNRFSKRTFKLTEGTTVKIITRRKYWSYVSATDVYGGQQGAPNASVKGWIRTKVLK